MALRRLLVLPDGNQNDAISKMATMGSVQKDDRGAVLGMMNRPDMAKNMKPDERAIPSILAQGPIKPGVGMGARVIDERGGGGGMAAPAISYAPSSGGAMSNAPVRTDMLGQASSRQPSAEVAAARSYTPEAVKSAPGFVNYYEQLTAPFDESYRSRAEAAAISNAERQYAQAADRIRSQLASRGLMSGGGTGLEGALMAQAAMESAGARERAITAIGQDVDQKRADYNLRRAEGMMRAQDEQYRRFVDEQLLPMKIAESKEQVKQLMLKNGLDQYAIDQYLKMDVSEWPDWLKNTIKVGIMGLGVYTGQPGIVAAGASYR